METINQLLNERFRCFTLSDISMHKKEALLQQLDDFDESVRRTISLYHDASESMQREVQDLNDSVTALKADGTKATTDTNIRDITALQIPTRFLPQVLSAPVQPAEDLLEDLMYKHTKLGIISYSLDPVDPSITLFFRSQLTQPHFNEIVRQVKQMIPSLETYSFQQDLYCEGRELPRVADARCTCCTF